VRLALALLLAASIALAPSAGASHPRLIVLGKSIGPVRIGMSEQAVVRALGKPRVVKNANYGGKPLRVATFGVHGGRFDVDYDRATRKVVGIQTNSRYFKTAAGIGPGSPLRLVRALPGFRFGQCTANWEADRHGVLVSFVPQAGANMVESVAMIRPAYTSC